VHGERRPARFLHQGHGGNIRLPIAEVDHVRPRNRALLLGHVLVDALTQILDALVDAEEILRLAGVGDDALGERRLVGLEPVFAGEHIVEVARDRRALDDLGQSRRNEVVAQLDTG